MMPSLRRALVAGAALVALACAAPADARSFRWANDGDVNSMDPYARNETFLLAFLQNIYEPLVRRDKTLKLEPGLAEKWGQTAPTTWYFDLRKGVKFHDGSPLTAEDVLFSMERAEKLPGGQYASFVQRLTDRRAVDPYTVRVKTATPYAMVPYDL
ncbi:MAG: ABC transporter substrate-binding protein, partial [Alphaproteobacteria bacterium]